jgi:hypothetical protein
METAGVRSGPKSRPQDARGRFSLPAARIIASHLAATQPAATCGLSPNLRHRRPLRRPYDAVPHDLLVHEAQSASGGLAAASGRA